MTSKKRKTPSKRIRKAKTPPRKQKAHKRKARGRTGSKAAPLFTWPIWETKKQAAEVLGWPVSLLSQIQKAGCPGFRHSRVYFGEVVTWLGTRGLDDADIDWSRELKKQQAIAAKRVNLERDRVLANVDEINEANQRALSILFGALDRIFCSELPPMLKDLDPLAIKGRCEKEITRLKQELHEKFIRLANEKRQSKDSDDEETSA